MEKTNVIRTKISFVDGLKKLTNLITKSKLDVDGLDYVISKYKIDNTIIKKIISYVCNYSNVIIYINKYLNDLGNNYNLIDFIISFRYILQMNGILDSRNFLYIKSSDQRNTLQQQIIKLLDDYFQQVYKISFNYRELLFYYNLFQVGVITKNDIYEIDLLLNNNVKTINLPDFIVEKNESIDISVEEAIKNIKSTPRNIDSINNEIYQKKMSNCKNCKFFQNLLVPIDGNLGSNDDLDVLIINLHPTLEDYKNKKIFKETSVVRKNIEIFSNELKWLMINLIPCSFKSKSEIGQTLEINSQIDQCKNIMNIVLEKFKPKFYILLGEEVSNRFISEPFNESIGKLVNNQFLPIFHPSSMRNPKSQIRGNECWKFIQNIIHTKTEVKEEQTQEIGDSEIPKKRKKSTELLLLDIKELSDGTVLMVYTDKDGNKIYEKKKNTQTGYIKKTNYNECGLLVDKVDTEFNMNCDQKRKLAKLLRDKMNELKRR